MKNRESYPPFASGVVQGQRRGHIRFCFLVSDPVCIRRSFLLFDCFLLSHAMLVQHLKCLVRVITGFTVVLPVWSRQLSRIITIHQWTDCYNQQLSPILNFCCAWKVKLRILLLSSWVFPSLVAYIYASSSTLYRE
jgi:hypothetical protein